MKPDIIGWDGRLHVSRRTFLAGSAVALVGAGGTAAALVADAASNQSDPEGGLRAVSMAMHVHASASEGPGSMQAQLVQAAHSGVDVLWWTEHDHRMIGHDAPSLIAFSGMTEQPTGAAKWQWTASSLGTPAKTEHTFCTRATHPELGTRESAALITCQAHSAGLATHQLDGQAENLLNRTSLAGMRVSFDVYPLTVSGSAYLTLQIVTSFRPQRAGVPAGKYVLSYRVGGVQTPGVAKLIDDTTAVITMAAPPGRWTTLTVDPQADLSRMWSGVDGRDAALFDVSVAATARGRATSSGYFAALRFSRMDSASAALQTQARLIEEYAPQFPTVRQIRALEVSLTTPHLGWYGGQITLPEYTNFGPLPSQDPQIARAAVDTIHRSGGLASYCHPYGTAGGELPAAEQERARAAKSSELVANRALGCDLLEVGYRLRGGCTLEQHESLWDNCSRNSIFLTGLGVNDDHKGMDWLGEQLNFVTWAWTTDTSTNSLLAALRRGRVYFGDPARFRGRLDLQLDGRSAMGAVSVADKARTQLTLLTSGLPSGAVVSVLRGTVDMSGPQNTTPEIATDILSKSRFDAAGHSTITVDTSRSRFVRIVVKDAQGLPIAFSNPVWLLRSKYSGHVPASRKLA